jgi:hypothetical protein
VLLGWATLLILFVSTFRRRAETRGALLVLSVVVPFILLASQLQLFQPGNRVRAEQRMYAALALDLGVQDDSAIMPVYPTDTQEMRRRIYATAPQAVKANLSIFAIAEMEHARLFVGQAPGAVGLKTCSGNVDVVVGVKTDPRYVRIAGWAFNGRTGRVPKVVYFVSGGTVTGAALTGLDRPDVASAINPTAAESGFEGYAKASASKMEVFCED